MAVTTVYFNPNCSKCRQLKSILDEREIVADYRHYLEEPPTVDELKEILRAIGADDAQTIVRSKESVYTELGLKEASVEQLLQAVSANPKLLERPIVLRSGRGVVARPPEKVKELL